MPEHFRDYLRMHAAQKHQAGERMPQVMEASARQSRLSSNSRKVMGKIASHMLSTTRITFGGR